jgi:hypothetical protein
MRTEKSRLKKDIKRVLKNMDFIWHNYLEKEKKFSQKQFDIYYSIYQQLGMAWEYLGRQCKHWEGFKNLKGEKHKVACGKIKNK